MSPAARFLTASAILAAIACGPPPPSRPPRAPVSGTDLAGRWFEQRGSDPVIDVIKTGSDFNATIINDGKMAGAGGSWHCVLTAFSASGSSLSFTEGCGVTYPNGEPGPGTTDTYSLTLSADFMRLEGSRVHEGFNGAGTYPVTLYRRD